MCNPNQALNEGSTLQVTSFLANMSLPSSSRLQRRGGWNAKKNRKQKIRLTCHTWGRGRGHFYFFTIYQQQIVPRGRGIFFPTEKKSLYHFQWYSQTQSPLYHLAGNYWGCSPKSWWRLIQLAYKVEQYCYPRMVWKRNLNLWRNSRGKSRTVSQLLNKGECCSNPAPSPRFSVFLLKCYNSISPRLNSAFIPFPSTNKEN